MHYIQLTTLQAQGYLGSSGVQIPVGEETQESGIGMLMNLRKVANHPLLVRDQYDEHQLQVQSSPPKHPLLVRDQYK